MHPNLAKHLHTEECNKLIEEYEACNKENKYKRYIGVCSDIQNKMTACIQNELRQRRHIGAENSKNRDLDHYMKTNQRLAEKVKLLDELKNKKEQEQSKN